MQPAISVVIPVHNASANLAACLGSLRESRFENYEVIVVDDGSTDDSPKVALEHGAKVLTEGTRRGPAHARNIGARVASGSILFFIDSDVCVHPDTLLRVRQAFQDDPALDALIGSYDDSPGATDFLSQYKNLMHFFVHQTSHEEACTFWSGCGAIRRDVFLRHSGFDESYGRPAIEDIELGYRLSQAGCKLLLDKQLRVKHLKVWTFWGLVKTDMSDRGIPWTELIFRDRHMPNDLNIQLSQRVSVALAFVTFGIAAIAAIYWRGYFLTPLFALIFFALGRYWVDGGNGSARVRIVFLTIGIAALSLLAWFHGMIELVPMVLLGYALLVLRHRYAVPGTSKRKVATVAIIVNALIALLFIVMYLPTHPLVLAFFLMLVVLVVLNNQFYLFLAAKRGRAFAIAAIPFHLLYHFYNGMSFIIGFLRYAVHPRRHESRQASRQAAAASRQGTD